MSLFIEEFYYGNIDPQARSTKENKAVQTSPMKLLSQPKHRFKICLKSNSISKK